MAKPGFDVSGDIAKFNNHRRDVKRGMIATAKGAAKSAQRLIRERAPKDTTALADSVYVQTREANGSISSDYDRNIVAAAGQNMRIENRGQDQDEITPPNEGRPGDAKAYSAVAVPLDYGDILRDGYPDVKRGIDVPPDPYFDSSVEEAGASYRTDAQKMLDQELRKINK